MVEAGDDRGLGGAALVLVLLLVADLDHALERQDAVERRRRRFDAARRARCIVASTAASTGSLTRTTGAMPSRSTVSVAVHRAAREQLARRLRAHRRFDRVPARRQPQPQLEPFGVDRFQLPGPGVGPG